MSGGALARSVKCALEAGVWEGRAAVLKRLVRDAPPWRWYFERERSILRALRGAPCGVATPALLDEGDDWLVMSRLAGAPLARGRRAVDPSPSDVVAALDAAARWSAWSGASPDIAPDALSRKAIRASWLEDPGGGVAWCEGGLGAASRAGWISAGELGLALGALRAHPVEARAHGDLLPRNVIASPAGVGLVDLECAGVYPEAWDAALLWANVSGSARAAVEARFGVSDSPRGRAFLACAAWALAREVRFARRSPRASALSRELRDTLARLR